MKKQKGVTVWFTGLPCCGKTTIAILAAAIFLGKGYQVALMCPTESLAIQHHLANFNRWVVTMRPNFGNVKYVEAVVFGFFSRHYLHLQRP